MPSVIANRILASALLDRAIATAAAIAALTVLLPIPVRASVIVIRSPVLIGRIARVRSQAIAAQPVTGWPQGYAASRGTRVSA